MRWTKSVIWRFAALVFLLQLACAAVALTAVRQLTRDQLESASREVAANLHEELLANYRMGGLGAVGVFINARIATESDDQSIMLLLDPLGRPVAGNLDAWPPNVAPGDDWHVTELFRSNSDQPERMGLTATALPDGSRLLVGHVVDNDLRFGGVLEEAMLGAILLALPLAALAAYLSARLIRTRLRSVIATAAAIETGDMERRIPADGSGDAFDQLGQSINAMLDRITALLGELRLVTDGLAHDLRSPLTRLKAVVERSLAESRDPPAIAALERALDETDTVLAMLNAALLVSRAEAGIGRDQFKAVDIGAMLRDLQEMYGALAEDHGAEMTVDAPDGLVAPAHRELLGQALANLIDNALKYGGKTIALSARRADGFIAVRVADDGPGIAEDQRAEALRRFGRLDASRHLSGAGLGLSLGSAVARLHGGALTLSDNAPGLMVELTLAVEAGAH